MIQYEIPIDLKELKNVTIIIFLLSFLDFFGFNCIFGSLKNKNKYFKYLIYLKDFCFFITI